MSIWVVQAGASELSLAAFFHTCYLSETGKLLSFYYYFFLIICVSFLLLIKCDRLIELTRKERLQTQSSAKHISIHNCGTLFTKYGSHLPFETPDLTHILLFSAILDLKAPQNHCQLSSLLTYNFLPFPLFIQFYKAL